MAEQELINLLNITDDQYMNSYKVENSFSYPRNVVKGALTKIFSGNLTIQKVSLYFVLLRDNPSNKSIINEYFKIISFIGNDCKKLSKDFIIFLASFYKYKILDDEFKALYKQLFFNRLEAKEILNLFEGDILTEYLPSCTNIIQKWFPIIKNKNDGYSKFALNCLDYPLGNYKYKNAEELEVCIDVASIYNSPNLADIIVKNYDPSIAITQKLFNMTPIDYINKICKEGIIPIINKETCNILADKGICDELYNRIILYDIKLWPNNKRFSKELLLKAFKKGYYEIIIDNLNFKDFDIDINIDINYNLAKLFTKKNVDYINIGLVLKNCKEFDVSKILDYINERMQLGSELAEFLIKFCTVDFNLLKKFLRINTYIADIERFNIPYDEALYKACNMYYIFPEPYIEKMPNKNLMIMRTYFYKNHPSSSSVKRFNNFVQVNNLTPDEYTFANYIHNYKLDVGAQYCIGNIEFSLSLAIILRASLFKGYIIEKRDDDILKILEKIDFI